jgi:hypothetical protein
MTGQRYGFEGFRIYERSVGDFPTARLVELRNDLRGDVP